MRMLDGITYINIPGMQIHYAEEGSGCRHSEFGSRGDECPAVIIIGVDSGLGRSCLRQLTLPSVKLTLKASNCGNASLNVNFVDYVSVSWLCYTGNLEVHAL
jgi:hypothetical protein